MKKSIALCVMCVCLGMFSLGCVPKSEPAAPPPAPSTDDTTTTGVGPASTETASTPKAAE